MKTTTKAGLAAVLTISGVAVAAPASADIQSWQGSLTVVKTTPSGAPLAGAQFEVHSCVVSLALWPESWQCDTTHQSSGADGVLREDPASTNATVSALTTHRGMPETWAVLMVRVTETQAPAGYQLDSTPRYYAAFDDDTAEQVAGTPNIANLQTDDENTVGISTVQPLAPLAGAPIDDQHYTRDYTASWVNQLAPVPTPTPTPTPDPTLPPANPDPTPSTDPTSSTSSTGPATDPSTTPTETPTPSKTPSPVPTPKPSATGTTSVTGSSVPTHKPTTAAQPNPSTSGSSPTKADASSPITTGAGTSVLGPQVQTDHVAQHDNGSTWTIAALTLAAMGALGVGARRKARRQ